MSHSAIAIVRNRSLPSLRPAAIAIAIGIAFAAPTVVQAAQTSSYPNNAESGATQDLPAIVVVASPDATPLSFTANPKIPRQPLPASDGADYLKTIPGFSAIRSGGTNGDLVFRGMFGSRLSILSNGTTMLGACGGRMDAPSSYISPESYDKVKVVKGPESVIYGPMASAATVLFERNTKRFDKPGMRFDGSLVGGSYGRNDQNADVTVGNEMSYARIIANHAHSDDYKDGNGNVTPSQWDKWNVDGSFGITPDDHTRIEATAGTGDGYARYAARGMDGVRFLRQSYGLRFDKSHIGTLLDRVEAQVYYNSTDHVMDNYTLRTPPSMGDMMMPMASDVSRTTVGGRLATTLRWADQFELVVGADMQTNRLYGRSGTQMVHYSSQPWTPSATFNDLGVFGELTWDFTDTQRLIAGLRADRASVRDDRVSISGMMGKSMLNPTAHEERTSTLPSGFVRYEQDLAAAPATWYVGIGHSERAPDYWELFSPTMGPTGSVNAFSGVQPEKTTQLDIGAQYTSAALDLWASAYAGYVQDFILFDYGSMKMGSMSQASNVNARILGGELGATWRPTTPISFTGALSYSWAQNAATGAPLPQIPPLDARFGAEYQHGSWSAGGLWRIVAAQHRYALHEGNVVGKDFGPSAGFGVLSVHAGYRLSKSVDLSIGIDNLLNKAYAEHLNLAGNAGVGFSGNTPLMEPGRIAWARLSIKMK